MNFTEQIEQEETKRLIVNKTIPPLAPGGTMIVDVNVVEGTCKCMQVCEGVVIVRRSRGLNSSFTVRKTSSSGGVERTFQLCSPLLASIEAKCRGGVRCAKPYYLRQRSGKSAHIKEKLTFKRKEVAAE